MLTLTENASTAVTSMLAESTDTPEAGLRIYQAPSDASLNLTLVEAPLPGDEVIEDGPAKVFLDAAASTVLEDKVLDAQFKPDGGLQFTVGQQA